MERLLLVNERYRQMYSLSAEQAKPGRHLREILEYLRDAGAFDQDPEKVAAIYVRGALPPSREMRLPDGRVILFQVQPRPGGGWVSTHEDITELRQREASFRLVFESNPLPMWINDRDNLHFLDVNSAAVEHYGYSREQFLEMTLLDIRPPEDWEELRSAVGDRSDARGRTDTPAPEGGRRQDRSVDLYPSLELRRLRRRAGRGDRRDRAQAGRGRAAPDPDVPLQRDRQCPGHRFGEGRDWTTTAMCW